MSNPNYINIACGDTFIEGWTNYDYATLSSSVIKANLLQKLPIKDQSVDLVYSSHFVEHIPRTMVSDFLNECFRISKSGGRIRIVLPDLGELCKSYLLHREQGEHRKADFIILEMLDQCVRVLPGGELNNFYNSIDVTKAENTEMISFVKQRNGHDLLVAKDERSLWQKIRTNPEKIFRGIESIYTRLLLSLLPPAFRQQNVSLVNVGERHAWIYDFQSITVLLKQVGFTEIKKVTAESSSIHDFPFYPLDLTELGQPRKGLESMYIEALRP